MKKLTSFIVLFVLGTNLINATIVKTYVAKQIAEDFYKQVSTQPLTAATLAYTETSANGEAVYYVFNINDGFVIVAANDEVLPIISYSVKGKFVAPKPAPIVITIDKWAAKNWATQPSKA